METLPWYVYLIFCATLLLAAWLFFKATHHSKIFAVIAGSWVLVQSIVGIRGFYSDPVTMTARYTFLILPPVITLVFLFVSGIGRTFIDGLNLKTLTIFHIIRVPVEITLFLLFAHKSIPHAMTFEGRNFDILSGLSAPFIYYFYFINKKIGRWGLITWNLICVLLLLNVVSIAALSLPGRFVQFGFERPNLALGFFPFLLLPTFLVPMVLLTNFSAVRQLITKKVVPNKIH
jgi:hypothetical protein